MELVRISQILDGTCQNMKMGLVRIMQHLSEIARLRIGQLDGIGWYKEEIG